MGGACCGSARSVQVAPLQTAVVPQTPSASEERPGDDRGQGQAVSSTAPAPVPKSEPEPQSSQVASQEVVSGSLTAPPTPAVPEKRPKKKTLVKAVKDNDLTLMDELLNSGCNLEELGMWDNTPLLAACSAGHGEAALKLIDKGADIFAKNEHGGTPLHYAAVEGLFEVTEALITSARSQGVGKEIALVNCGFAKVYNRHLDAYARRIPLGSAAESGFPELVKTLLDAGALMEDAEEDGRSPLWLACYQSRTAVVRLLLQYDVDVGSKDSNGVSVLEAATLNNCNEELVLALINHGVADVNDTHGSPLREAVKAGKRAAVEALLTHGAAVQPKLGTGAMPLHAACEKGDEYLVLLLVKNRADPSLSDAAGLTAFDLLRKRGFKDGQIVGLLKSPTAAAGDGSTGSTGEAQET